MKITNRFKKLFALFFVLAVVIPLTSSFGVWDMLVDTEDALATDKIVNDNTVAENAENAKDLADPTVDTGSLNYKFALNEPVDLYNFDASFSFDGVPYKGVFNNNIKETSDNTKLKVGDLGTIENPYVVLEITPVAAVSALGPHVANAGYFDMTQKELDAIELTQEEKNVIRLQALYQLANEDKAQDKKTEAENKVRDIKALVEVQYAAEILADLIAINPNYQYYVEGYIRLPIVEKYCAIYDPDYPKYKAIVEALNVKDTVNNRVDDDVTPTLDSIEAALIANGFITQSEYDDYMKMKYSYALQYKKDYYQSITYNRLLTNVRNKFNLEYRTQYEVGADGKFVLYKAGDKKTVITTGGKPEQHSQTNTVANEIKLTTQIINPMFLAEGLIWGNDNNKVIDHSNTFTKGCLDVAFNTILGETGRVESQTAYIDDYVFAGWSVMLPEEGMTSVNSLADDYNLAEKGITELYTNWSVRYYEQEEYQILTTASYVPVTFESEDATYTVMLPDCIASKQEGLHDIRNQLSMCLAKQSKFLTCNQGGANNKKFRAISETSGKLSYVDEYSAWDFNFAIDKYATAGDLKKVAPKLMADTDYYVLTKNVKYDPVTGTVTYYPYNVLVITITPDELNKMVYYDEVYRNKDASVGYQKSEYLNKFLDAVDFVYFSNGGKAVEYDGGAFGNASVADPTFGESQTIRRAPIKEKNPLLYTINADGTVTYDESNVKKEGTYDTVFSDLEWQVAEKIYQRVAEPKDFAQSGKGQARSMVVIFQESLGDNISAKSGTPKPILNADGEPVAGSENNLCKLMLLFFVYKDPTVLYQKYVDADYVESMNGIDITFDKIKGAVRTVGNDTSGNSPKYNGSSFTGVLYACEKWNQALFFPYEYFDPAYSTAYHFKAMVEGGIENFQFQYDPWTNQKVAGRFYDVFGLALNVVFKNIANPYAYTYNDGEGLGIKFYSYDIAEISNPTNHFGYGGNSDLAFEYFRRVRPTEIKNGKIATKSAIEFMVQNANNSSVVTNKTITILNKAEDRTRFNYTNTAGTPYTVYVDTVIVDDFSSAEADVEYKYTNTDEGFFVPEVLWTKQYSQVDNNFVNGATWYVINTSKEDTDPLKWYVVPGALDNANKNNYFITYDIAYSEGTDASGNKVTNRDLTRTKAVYSFENNGNVVQTTDAAIVPGNEYYFEALLKPSIKGETYDQRTYMIAVKQYDDYQAYLNGKEPENIIVKNVTMEKLSYLFNLD